MIELQYVWRINIHVPGPTMAYPFLFIAGFPSESRGQLMVDGGLTPWWGSLPQIDLTMKCLKPSIYWLCSLSPHKESTMINLFYSYTFDILWFLLVNRMLLKPCRIIQPVGYFYKILHYHQPHQKNHTLYRSGNHHPSARGPYPLPPCSRHGVLEQYYDW